MAQAPPAESLSAGAFRTRWFANGRARSSSFSVRAEQRMEGASDKIYKDLGLFSLKKKINDAVARVETITPVAMELEEERKMKQEEVLRKYNLWDDINASNESLTALADAIKVINGLKEVQHKAEEAKLISQLADMDIINNQLFKQAYIASLDVSKFLDRYEMSKLLNGSYDREGACMVITAGMEGTSSEMWTERLLSMYTRWAGKHDYSATVLEKFPSNDCGAKSAIIEFEEQYMYGYLSGEKGIHKFIHSSLDGSVVRETCSASIDVVPLFLENMVDFNIEDREIEISYPSYYYEAFCCKTKNAVSIRHIPTNTVVQSSGERSQFANKMKALNRLKSKLLVMTMEEGVDPNRMKDDSALNKSAHEVRRYMFRPHKSVHDLKTGVILHKLNSVLDGNIEPFLRSHINLRRGRGLAE
ncbi:hypothetical protein AXF42_Ash004484 [Apostasia shenzhenica]|uniref:Peptide chain release factor domain-containing protein n=1 Tax=Apostasia shenzhenica TaxID=1088818 RepID=A0A2I0BGR3_9ASPA|nr:hypothetical protein AXF42_Ash004484 [Apostasia shenzhenica]